MHAILFDLDGVLYEGDKVITGAAEVIDWVNKKHIPHLFLTNTTSKPRSALVDKLSGFGIETQVDQYLTPPLAAIEMLNKKQIKHIAAFVPDVTLLEFSGFTLCHDVDDEVEAVVIGDLARDWSFKKLNDAFLFLMNNPDALLIALGMTRFWRTQDGLQLDAGPFVKALEYATGREAVVTGKPAAAFYHAAMNRLSFDKDIFMIGDDIRGDIEAAQQVGLKTIQVRSGKFSESDLDMGIKPDVIFNTIADLPHWWQQQI